MKRGYSGGGNGAGSKRPSLAFSPSQDQLLLHGSSADAQNRLLLSSAAAELARDRKVSLPNVSQINAGAPKRIIISAGKR